MEAIRIGADVGGTFTDVVLITADGEIRTHKLPSTPPQFDQAVIQAIVILLDEIEASGDQVAEVAHGTTVATNTVLEHRGAHTALITTRGFRDVLELRRIRAPQMYDLFFEKPKTLVDRYLRLELGERLSATGETLAPLSQEELQSIKKTLEKEQVESVAVCLLHAYAYPQHELAVGEFLHRHLPHLPVSLSSDVLRERREYERTATTVVNAYVRPVMQNYLQQLRNGLREQEIEAPLLIMQSAGGLMPEQEAAVLPVFVLESGPAAGVLAANHVAQQMGLPNVITFDMGGTTAKAAMIEDNAVAYSPEYEVGATLSAGNRLTGGGGELIRAPSIDIAEVGAGGGSIAYLDRAGGLHVGPRSMGAMPGPACYGRGGTTPTVTDANVVLGYIRPGELADGEVAIDYEAACRAVHDHIAAPMQIDLIEAADGIHRIANARMMRALRAVSTERGRDPREFVLMAFGGSGPVHAAGLAKDLYIGRTIVPPVPGLFSALGLLFSGVEHHSVRSCSLAGEQITPLALQQIRTEMQTQILDQFRSEGFAPDDVTLNYSVDIRFQGQASEIRIPLQLDGSSELTAEVLQTLQSQFEEEHLRLYGHLSEPDNPLEIVALRLIGRTATQDRNDQGPLKLSVQDQMRTGAQSRNAFFGADWGTVETPVVTRQDLVTETSGPLLVDEYDATTVVPPDAQVRLDEQGNLVLRL